MGTQTDLSKTLILVKQSGEPSAKMLGRLSKTQLQIWNELGAWGKTVSQLEEAFGDLRVAEELETLLGYGVIAMDDLPAADKPELHELTTAEEQLLRAPCELDPKTKTRVLLLARAIAAGQLQSMLELPKNPNKRDVKRAYYSLSKELHPDRYHGRELGPFKGILETLFGTLSQYIKVLSDKRTVLPRQDSDTRDARRGLRYTASLTVKTRCASWPRAEVAVSQDISSAGVFLHTEREAQLGEAVQVAIATPDGWISTAGTIVSICDKQEALRLGREPGFGVRFSKGDDSKEAGIAALLLYLREQSPQLRSAPSDEKPLRINRDIIRGSEPIIGIDLGTTNTSVAFTAGNRVRIMPWQDGTFAIPSVVAFPKRGQSIVGQAAQERLIRDPRYALGSSKRLIGQDIDDPAVANFLASSGVSSQAGPGGAVLVDFWGELYAIPQLCSYLFSAAKESASRVLGHEVSKAVITVPVCFNPAQRDAMRRAAKLAHLEAIEVVEEPCAAAVANQGQEQFQGTIGVYDFGGGTFDFSLVEANRGEMRVLATAGDSWLGGDDFDLAIANTAADSAMRAQGVDLRSRVVEWQTLLRACELAKRALSEAPSTRMVVPGVLRNKNGLCDMRMQLTRAKVEPLWNEVIGRSVNTCLQALAVAQVSKSKLSAIYMSGGTSYIPAVRAHLERVFKVPIILGVAPEFAVAAGAGVRAAHLERQ